MEETKTAGTIFLDIDGTLFRHYGSHYEQICREPEVLAGVKDRLEEWDKVGFRIVLVTGRRESCRKLTEDQLLCAGIFYDQLIMGCGNGARWIVNDAKPDGSITAGAVCVPRNKGLASVNI